MNWGIRRQILAVRKKLRSHTISTTPTHVAVIQDGNRRYARQNGNPAPEGHRDGAETTEQVLEWCMDIGIKELTLYAFSTENFNRPPDEQEALFDLLEEKLYEFADTDRVHDNEVQIRGIGTIDRLPARVQQAVSYAEQRTQEYDDLVLNIALAYGGRVQLLKAAQNIAAAIDKDSLAVDDIDTEVVEQHLSAKPVRDVDLLIRTGGEKRTSNFLPWHASGNEAAVFFCDSYWPEFSKLDFLHGLRIYERQEQSRQQIQAQRARALVNSISKSDLPKAQSIIDRVQSSLPTSEHPTSDPVDQ